jgi:hypothetical protein
MMPIKTSIVRYWVLPGAAWSITGYHQIDEEEKNKL